MDDDAEFFFVPADSVMSEAERLGASPFDVKGVELGHHGRACSFEAILKKYDLDRDPTLVLLGKIANGADTDNTLWNQPEGPGLEAIAEGFRNLGFKDDHELNSVEWIVYDALFLDSAEGRLHFFCEPDPSLNWRVVYLATHCRCGVIQKGIGPANGSSPPKNECKQQWPKIWNHLSPSKQGQLTRFACMVRSE